MRTILTLIAALLAGGWTVTHERDRMTDKTLAWASARSGDATLLVGCLNGEAAARIVWERPVVRGRIGLSYRIDEAAVVPRFAIASQDRTTLYPWIGEGVGAFRKASRVRVDVPGLGFYDFNVKAGEALPGIKC